MCGICGEIVWKGKTANTARVEAMCEVMVPRGPDGSGVFRQNNVALGHRRLKIIDLSDAASQPMTDNQLGLTIAFNGAIYNYRELREELLGLGYTFFSQGDTEVILKSYHAWGIDCVKHFNGMFAFAIFERDSGRVFLARDRLGIKPLYLAETAEGLRFSSSLPALLRAGGLDTSIDPIALAYYLTWHSIVPPPRTILKGIKKLPPATRMVIEADGQQKQSSYWSLRFETPADRTNWQEKDWVDATLQIMRKAVQRRLVADVPVGVLLSGGLDSSLITGLICENGSAPVDTFSIGFESVNNETGDEFKYSDIIVDRFQTNHHKLFIDSANTIPALLECIAAMSEPMVSHDNVGFYLLSREVSKHVKVVQSGQGADEVFGGYHWYPPMLESSNPVADYARVFFDRNHAEYQEVVAQSYTCAEDHPLRFVEEFFDSVTAERPVDKALYIDSLFMLVDDPVKRVDNHTMASSLEARVPFLDHEVLEFAATMPAELKIRDGGKYILKEAARQVIPAGVIDRPKGYFPVPALKYLQGDFLELTREVLLNDHASSRGLFRRKYVEKLLSQPEQHITPLGGSKLYQLALLELWLQSHHV